MIVVSSDGRDLSREVPLIQSTPVWGHSARLTERRPILATFPSEMSRLLNAQMQRCGNPATGGGATCGLSLISGQGKGNPTRVMGTTAPNAIGFYL